MIERMKQLTLQENSLALWGLGQMGFALQAPQGVIYIDPYLSDYVRENHGDFWVRAYPSPLSPERISNADLLMITHEHLDHLDPATVKPLMSASPQAQIITSGWCRETLNSLGIAHERIQTPETLTPMTIEALGVRITAIPSAHPTLEHHAEKGHRWLGFLIEWNGITLYHAGDTVIYEGYLDTLRQLPKLDIAILPVNGRDAVRETQDIVGNLLPEEAAFIAREIPIGLLIFGHNDLFPNNALPNSHLIEALDKYAPQQPYKQLRAGELLYYKRA